MVSGGFDPLHVGHLRLLMAAAAFGDVLVALNSDAWLERKKGYRVMPWEDRAALIIEYPFVRDVISFDDADGTVCDALYRYRPDYFANGGDRETADPREHAVCHELGIKELFGIGGDKIRSSSQLIGEIRPLS